MEKAIKLEIKRLCRKKQQKNNTIQAKKNQYREKFKKRTGIQGKLPQDKNPYLNNHFDPAHCARHSNIIARTIWEKVCTNTYRPIPAIKHQIPKPNGGVREIMAFSIPDSALANVIFRNIRDRNVKKLSPFSYAYDPRKNLFDAILALKSGINYKRLFSVQIDFQNYFDSIPTKYMNRLLDDRELVATTPHERFVLKEFMRHQFADRLNYQNQKFSRRHRGTPQGSSISLFLANLANHELDMALERKSGKFVRYADDVVALCSSYAEAEQIEETFIGHCKNSGLIINEKKSPGIALIKKIKLK